ncbi:MAG: tol-pal system protein YbgF [Pseudomonadota bacterium]
MRFIAVCVLCLMPVLAQGQSASGDSVGDIRADLETLEAQISALRQELQETGGTASGVVNAAPVLERIQLLEAEMVRVTGEVEKLAFRVNRIVADGTNRIDDLKYRLTELEGGNTGAIPATPPLGSQEAPAPAPETTLAAIDGSVRPRLRDGGGDAGQLSTGFETSATTPVPEPTAVPEPTVAAPAPAEEPKLAIAEREDFDRAKAAFDAGDFATSAALFGTFLADYQGSALAEEATFLRGEAFAQNGDWQNATRAYLDTFSGAPQGPRAAEALYNVGRSLGKLGRVAEACQTLNEVFNRYPGSPPDLIDRTNAEKALLGCV